MASGACDYVCKPFSFREVVALIKAAPRQGAIPEEAPENSGLNLDESRYTVFADGRQEVLTAIELKLIRVFVGRTMTGD